MVTLSMYAIGSFELILSSLCLTYSLAQLYSADTLEVFLEEDKTDFTSFINEKVNVKEPLPSILHVFQQKTSVQIAIKMALFAGDYTNVILAFAMSSAKLERHGGSHPHSLIRRLCVFTELFHNICVLFITNYLATKPENYTKLFTVMTKGAVTSFGIKCVFSAWHTTEYFISATRLLLCLVLALAYRFYVGPVSTQFTADLHSTCIKGCIELVVLGSYLFSQAMDFLATKDMEMIINLNDGDEEEEERHIELPAAAA